MKDLADWREQNACTIDGRDRTEGFVRRQAWDCADSATVELVTPSEQGHEWSGAPIENAAPCAGPNSDRISMTQEAWRFFQAHGVDRGTSATVPRASRP